MRSGSTRRFPAVFCVLAALGGAASAAPAARLEVPALRAPVGRFAEDGRYLPPARRARFGRLHGEAAPKPRYPVVLVHGLGGFDRITIGPLYGDYFNGVARRYRRDGIAHLVPATDSRAAIRVRAAQLKAQILAAGWPKVNLVCHSMGGLDARYMVTHLGMADRVASITTVATPHHGSWYADWVLEWVFQKQGFGKFLDLIGRDYSAIPELTVKFLQEEFNPTTPDMPQVRYFSLGGNQGYGGTVLVFRAAKLVIELLEKRAVGRRASLPKRLAAKALVPGAGRRGARVLAARGLDAAWVRPEVAGQNDSKVSVSSAMWGEYLGTLDADHWDVVGWFGKFDAPRFYRGIAHMLADAGF